MIRPAVIRDVSELLEIEARCFDSDRLSARSFRDLLARDSAAILVETAAGRVRGYVLVLFRRNSAMARIYSFAVSPQHRRLGIGERLMAEAMDLARARGCTRMRLELRRDNDAARTLYERAGFRLLGETADYYEDHMDALRLERPLSIPGESPRAPHSFRGKGKLAA